MPRYINGLEWPTAQLDTIEDTVDLLAHHNHASVRWIGEHGARNLEVACGTDDTMTMFQTTAGNNTWGVALCLIGTGDGPFIAGMTMYALHVIHIADVAALADTDTHLIRMMWGMGTAAQAETAEQYTDIEFAPLRAGKTVPKSIMMPRVAYGTNKLWAKHWTSGENATTMDFKIGLHESD